jgi:hypothetical protein
MDSGYCPFCERPIGAEEDASDHEKEEADNIISYLEM